MSILTSEDRRWSALALIVTAQFMVILDVAIVNVALPSIKSDLGFSQTNLQWVISYTYRVAGKGYKGRSWMMPEVEARKYSRGDHGTIRFDPDRPEQSLWMHERAAGGSERVQDA